MTTTKAPAKKEKSDAAQMEFVAGWREFFTAVRRARGRYAREADGGLTLSQHQVLLALGDEDGLRTGELAARAGIAAPTTTRMLDGLERAGIVERRNDALDRRAVTVHLTDEGRAALRKKRGEIERKLAAVYESLPAAERDRAAGLLRTLAVAIEEL